MLSTPLICCSMGVATDCSTVSASPPGYVAETRISGGVMLGYCDTGKNAIVIVPMITTRMEITIATIGRRTKNRAIAGSLRGRRHGRRGGSRFEMCNFHLCVLPHLLKPLHHYPLSRLESLGHDPIHPISLGD